MKKFKCGSLIVVDGTKVIGILTEHDILTKVVAEAEDSSKIKVKSVMTDEVVMIDPDLEIGEAAQIMMEREIKKLPVVHNKKIVGIITASDLIAVEPKLMEQIGALTLLTKKKTMAG